MILRVDYEFLPLVQRIASRETTETLKGFTIVHANLISPKDWGYILDIDDAFPNFELCEDQICFIGHSHKAIVFKTNATLDWLIKERIEIESDTKYIINIGSVGQPRDGNPKASFAIYDTQSPLVEIRRLSYDIPASQEKIIKAGLSRILADRLSFGN